MSVLTARQVASVTMALVVFFGSLAVWEFEFTAGHARRESAVTTTTIVATLGVTTPTQAPTKPVTIVVYQGTSPVAYVATGAACLSALAAILALRRKRPRRRPELRR